MFFCCAKKSASFAVLPDKDGKKILQVTYPHVAVDLPPDVEFDKIVVIVPRNARITFEALDRIQATTDTPLYRNKPVAVLCYHLHGSKYARHDVHGHLIDDSKLKNKYVVHANLINALAYCIGCSAAQWLRNRHRLYVCNVGVDDRIFFI